MEITRIGSQPSDKGHKTGSPEQYESIRYSMQMNQDGLRQQLLHLSQGQAAF